MQLRDYLDLRGLKLSEFAAEYARRIGKNPDDADDMNAALVRLSRHVRGRRRPSDEDRAIYAEMTKGAVTAQDWHEAALKPKAEPDSSYAATETVAATEG